MNLINKKIFVALDFSDLKHTLDFVEVVKNHVGGLKLGLEFFTKNGTSGVEKIKKCGLPIFLDLKFNDIPNTVNRAASNVLSLNPEYLTIHINGGRRMIESIVSIKGKTKIIGVTMLTSLDNQDLSDLCIEKESSEYVKKLSLLGQKSGLDGVVSSVSELKILKQVMPDNFIFVTPGINLKMEHKDQRRTSNPVEAIKSGSSILIIGRTITMSDDPLRVIMAINQEISKNNVSPN